MKKEQKKITFHYLVKPFHFPQRRKLKDFLLKQFEREGKKVEAISYVFCNDDYLLELNLTYLNHETLTDILTFELSPQGSPLVADIYISVTRIRENANLFQVSFLQELLRVIFHGALHLVGYNDKSYTQRSKMKQKEEEYLRRYFVPHDTVS